MNIKYQIIFFSNWHCGSGLSAGADLDALVVKDSDNLPFVPGRTVKGLLREAAEEIYGNSELLNVLFGVSSDQEKNDNLSRTGKAFFSSATLADSDVIVRDKLQDYLYQSVASTSIGDDGIAKDHSLRKTETVIPLTLEGQILNVPAEAKEMLTNAMAYVKRMGTGRTRGLGRCKMKIME